jgi:copper chaperone CopZ
MKTLMSAIAVAVLACSSTVQAEVTVELSDMHICCGSCVKGIEAAVKDIAGVKVAVSKDDLTTKITADNAKAAQQAIAAIAKAGYHGNSDSKTIVMKDDSGAPSGNVKRLSLTGIHNCCGGCTKAVKAAMKDVPGYKDDNLVPKEKSFVVEGDFSAAALVKALNDAGFHVTVTK